jgi:hypothetical protein
MAQTTQGQVGPSALWASDGTNIATRQGKQGETVVNEMMPVSYEAAYRGLIYHAFINGVTLASTHASPIAAGTGTPIIGIYNPAGSGKNLVFMKTVMTTTSGTPGGPLLWNVIPNPQNITITPTAPISNLSFANTGSVAKLFNNAAITGSTAGVAYRVVGGPAAVAAGAGLYTFMDEHKGEFMLAPGGMLALAATAAGTSHIMSAFIQWMEMPV